MSDSKTAVEVYEAQIAPLRMENEQLRRSAQAFGELADRLNRALRPPKRRPALWSHRFSIARAYAGRARRGSSAAIGNGWAWVCPCTPRRWCEGSTTGPSRTRPRCYAAGLIARRPYGRSPRTSASTNRCAIAPSPSSLGLKMVMSIPATLDDAGRNPILPEPRQGDVHPPLRRVMHRGLPDQRLEARRERRA